MRVAKLCVYCALLFTMASQAHASSISVGASSDDYGDPELNLSSDPTDGLLRVFGVTESPTFPIRRGGLEFDITGVTAGATVTSANLFLHVSGTDIATEMQLYGYTGNGLVEAADLNDSTFLGTFNVTGSSGEEFHLDVTSFIQSQVNGSSSFAGFMIRPTIEGPNPTFNGADFASSENDPSVAPLLTVDFTTSAVPEPTSMALLMIGGIGAAAGAYRKRRQQIITA